MKKYNVAVIGATGNVGREVLNSLSQRKFPINKIFAVASPESVGKSVSFGDDTIKIYQMADLFLFPSFSEGFGIPIFQSIWGR